jgi:hypothetical protein
MARKKEKIVRVSFFELVNEPNIRLGDANWADRLANIDRNCAPDVPYNGRTLDGKVFEIDGALGLSLSIERIINPRERQRGTGNRKTMQPSGEDYDASEETVVIFFERNIIGILHTGQGAPSQTAVAHWLSVYSRPVSADQNSRWKALPITRTDVYEAVIKQKGWKVTESTFKVEAENLGKADYGFLGLVEKMFTDTEEGFSISVTFQAGRQRKPRNTQKLDSLVENALNTPSMDAIKIKAKGESGPQQAFNLLEDHITYQVPIEYRLFDAADSDFLVVASSEIRRAYHELRDILITRVPETVENL